MHILRKKVAGRLHCSLPAQRFRRLSGEPPLAIRDELFGSQKNLWVLPGIVTWFLLKSPAKRRGIFYFS